MKLIAAWRQMVPEKDHFYMKNGLITANSNATPNAGAKKFSR
jgi:hypothetical protein